MFDTQKPSPFALTPARIEELKAVEGDAKHRFDRAQITFENEQRLYAKTFFPVVYALLEKNGHVKRLEIFQELRSLGFEPTFELSDSILDAASEDGLLRLVHPGVLANDATYVLSEHYKHVLQPA